MGVTVRDALKGGKSGSRSADLQKLYQNYQVWCKQISVLVQALRAHQQSLLHIEKTRTAVSLLIIFCRDRVSKRNSPWSRDDDRRMTTDEDVE